VLICFLPSHLEQVRRPKWVDEAFEMLVFPANFWGSVEVAESLERELLHADILLVVAVTRQESVEWIQKHTDNVPSIICFESSATLVNKLGGSYVSSEPKENMLSKLVGFPPLKKPNEAREVLQTITNAWERYNSDDIRFCLLVIINEYIRPVPILKNLRSKCFTTLGCMVKNCGPLGLRFSIACWILLVEKPFNA